MSADTPGQYPIIPIDRVAFADDLAEDIVDEITRENEAQGRSPVIAYHIVADEERRVWSLVWFDDEPRSRTIATME